MSRDTTVITPVCGPIERTAATIQSVLSAAPGRVEYVVIGDVAELRSRFEAAPRGAAVRWLQSDVTDVIELINEGLRQTTARTVSWLLPGDRHFDDSTTIADHYLQTHPHVDVVYGDATGIDADGRPFVELNGKEWSRARLRRSCFFRQPAAHVRRSTIEAAGLLDPGSGRCADYDLWLRLADRGAGFAHLPRLLAAQRVDPGKARLWPTDERPSLADFDALNDTFARHRIVPGAPYLVDYGMFAAAWMHPETEEPAALAAEAGRLATALAGRLRYWTMAPPISRLFLARRLDTIVRRRRAAGTASTVRHDASHHVRRPKRLQAFRKRIPRHVHHAPRPLHVPADYLQAQPPSAPPTISIVTPSFNQACYLDATLRSVLDQDYPRLEYVVQDGGSTDGSIDVLRSHAARLTAWESKPDGGQSQAINLGMRRTTGEIMAYLNSDDLLLPGSLAYVARYFDEHPDVDVVYGHRVLIDGQGLEIGRWVLPPHDDRVITFADFIPQETMFWRRRAWDAAGGHIDESFRFAMDWDLILRFRSAGMRFVRLPRFLGAFRITDTQKTSSWWLSAGRRETERLTERAVGHTPPRSQIRRWVRPFMRRHFILDKLYLAGIVHY
jgi:GT2 family glycosyltransferase